MRSSGVLLHPTSLPSPGGHGTIGAEAREFVDFLAAAGQRWWQTLPLGPTGPGASPYQCTSAFAGNPLLIDTIELTKRGWLAPDDLPPAQAGDQEELADFEAVKVVEEPRPAPRL